MSPIEHANTGRCSALNAGRTDDRLVLVDVGDDRGDRVVVVAELRSARGIVWLTMNIVPPPTSFFAFVSARSGSMPVVSQSIIKPMVPVGASTDACELRTP